MLEKVAAEIAKAVKKSVAAATQGLFEKLDPRIEALEKTAVGMDSVKELILNAMQEFEKQLDEVVKKVVAEEVAAIPAAPPGQDGKSFTLEDAAPVIEKAVKEAFAAIPAPKDGEPGAPGKDADMTEIKAAIENAVKEAVAALPPAKNGVDGKDGTSVDREDVKIMVADAVAAIPTPQDGKSVPVEEVEEMVAAAVKKAVDAIELPKAKDGRDALDIEIMPEIDEEKSYPRGVYATHRGGLWKSWKQTSGMNGWECIVDGVYKTVVHKIDAREFQFICEKSSGSIVNLPFSVPSTIYRKVYRDGERYTQGDLVTWAGSVWHCEKETDQKPGEGSEDWTLAVKRGRDASPKVKV